MIDTTVFGAAVGVGAALLVALTVVMYRYYHLKKQAKEWHSLDKLPFCPSTTTVYQKVSNRPVSTYPRTDSYVAGKMSGMSPASCWITHKRLELWAKAAKERAWGSRNRSNSSSNSLEDFNVSKEQLNVQPPQNSSHSMTTDIISSSPVAAHLLHHQSKSYPGGTPLLCRTPSASSQSSLESTASKPGSHRGSSPQIRTFNPDGKVQPYHGVIHPDAGHTTSYPLQRTTLSSRSPSPHRTASLDIRSSSPNIGMAHIIGAELRTSSPSQSSLTSLTGGSGSSCNSPVPSSPRTISLARCLSPLFIPPSRGATPDSAAVPPASPLGAIQPDLYLRKDGPLFLGCDGQHSSGLGRLHFRLSYDFDRSDLLVHLIEAHDLAGSAQGGFNDPYVRLAILPEVDSRKRQTAIHRNDPNPLFNQLFKFPVSHEDVKSKTLILQVFDYDRFSRNDIIGEVSMSLVDFDMANSIEIWGELIKNKKPPEELQEILISLNYLPSAERLTLSIVKARNLFLPQDKDYIDPFVKVYLIVNGKRIKKKKTSAKKANVNPVWNEALAFNLNASSVANAELEICIYDQGNDIMGSNPLLGCCTIGPKSSGSGKEHWNDMIQSPRKTVFFWHTIR